MKKDSLDEARFRSWMASLIRKLLTEYKEYFSKDGILNSDGRKLLEDIIKPTVRRYPHTKAIARKVRKEPTIENVLKLARLYLSDEDVNAALYDGIVKAGLT